jgi:hypothetical protein
MNGPSKCERCGFFHVQGLNHYCRVCGFCCNTNADHSTSRAHCRRQEFAKLKGEWGKFELADSQARESLARINDILSTVFTDGIPLFYLEPKIWKSTRSVGPEYFRNLKLEDENKPELVSILDKLGAFFDKFPELQTTINSLRGSSGLLLQVQTRDKHGLRHLSMD